MSDIKNKEYLDLIVTENCKWIGHIKNSETGQETVYGLNYDLSYNDLKEKVKMHGLDLPPQKDLLLFKRTQARKIYMPPDHPRAEYFFGKKLKSLDDQLKDVTSMIKDNNKDNISKDKDLDR